MTGLAAQCVVREEFGVVARELNHAVGIVRWVPLAGCRATWALLGSDTNLTQPSALHGSIRQHGEYHEWALTSHFPETPWPPTRL